MKINRSFILSTYVNAFSNNLSFAGFYIFLLIFLFFISSIILINPAVAAAEELIYDFNAPVLTKSGIYHDISLNGLPLSIEPLMPALPFKPVAVLLPQGYEAYNIAARPLNLTEIKGEYFLRPVAYNIPLSFTKEAIEKKKHDALAGGGSLQPFEYKYSGHYPCKAMSNVSMQNARGYKILILNINPVLYQAETRKVYYYTRIIVEYKLKPAKKSSLNAIVRDIESDRESVKKLVDNPDAIYAYKNAAPADKRGFADYLIVTTKNLAAASGEYNFNKFVKFLNEKDVKVEISFIEDVLTTSEGRDSAEKLRNYLRKRYNENGIKYVMLAGGSTGTDPAIPVRKLHAAFKWENDSFDQLLPGDVYYSNLDGSFDENKDGIFGDITDGTGGNDIDMFSELSVGRVPVENATELANFIKKTIDAYGYFDQNSGRAFFCGENLFPGVWGKSYMKEIENGCSAHGFVTAGYPADYQRSYLFDQDRRWSSTDIINAINKGIYILNHIGHSSVTSNMRLSSWSMNRLSNSEYYLLYTQGCYCGRFTDKGCILSAHVTSPNGAYAVIGNSSYGLGPEDPDPDAAISCRGASQYFHRQFTNAIFASEKNRLGDANQASKEANVKFMGHGTTRWVFFELNLLGDPYLPIKIK